MTKTPPSSQPAWLDPDSIRDALDRNPYGVLAGALGIGFVLGGGLFTRFTGRIVGAAVRVGLAAALPHLQDELLSVGGRALADDEDVNAKDGDAERVGERAVRPKTSGRKRSAPPA